MQVRGVEARPTGTVTFLFTDIVGSTELWERHPAAMAKYLEAHDAGIGRLAATWSGYAFHHAGDSWGLAFADPRDAVGCALDLGRMLGALDTSAVRARVRMALDTGLADERDKDYYGPPLNRAARALEHAQGDTVLLTAATAAIVRHQLPPGYSLVDLGEFHLRGIPGWEHLYRLDFATRRRVGWRLRLQHGAWAMTVAMTVLAIWMALAGGPEADTESTLQPTPAAPSPPTTTGPSEGRVLWTSTDGSFYGVPTVLGGRVLVGIGENLLAALDLRTGSRIWLASTAGPIQDRPAVDSGHVFVVSEGSHLLVGYTLTEGSEVLVCSITASDITAPAAGLGRVFVVTTEAPRVWAYRSDPRNITDCVPVDGATTDILAFRVSDQPPALFGELLLVADTHGVVYAFDGRDLERGPLWTFDVPGASGTDMDTYRADVGHLSLLEYRPPSRQGVQPAQRWVVVAERRTRGDDEAWRLLIADVEDGGLASEPVTVGGPATAGFGRIWVGSIDRSGLVVLDRHLAQEHILPIPITALPPIIDEAAGRVYVVSPDGTVTAVNAVSLEVEWTHRHDGTVEAMSAGNGTVLVLDAEGRLTAISGP